MKSKYFLAILGCVVLGLANVSSFAADTAPARPTPSPLQAVHDCAAAKGVKLPVPPSWQPPKLTAEKRAIVDACFEEQGLTLPKGPPPSQGE